MAGFEPLWGAPKGGILRWWFRLIAGRPLDGRRRSDATFVRRGRQYIGPGWHTRWELLPGWLVLTVRLAGIYAMVIVVRGWWTDPSAAGTALAVAARSVRRAGRFGYDLVTAPWATLATLSVLAHLVGLVLVVLLVNALMNWRRDREIVRPLSLALAGPLGYAPDAPSHPWLSVPRVLVPAPPWRGRLVAGRAWRGAREWVDGRESPRWQRLSALLDRARPPAWWVRFRGRWALRMVPIRFWLAARASVRIRVPHELGGVGSDVRSAVMSAVSAKLPGDWRDEWRLSGSAPALRLRVRQHPPRMVRMDNVRPALEATKPDDVLIGLGIGGVPTRWTPESDSPHLLLSMGSGAGKSVLVRLIAVQGLAKGWTVILLDYKQDHYWAQELIDAGVPGIHYVRKIPDIHRALVELEDVREWRSDVDFEYRGKMPMQRVLIIVEEMNATTTALRTYWQSVKGKGDPAKSPALTAFGSLSAAGRSARMHLIGVGQYLTALVFGGPEARENFGARILGRYTVAAWRTLVPEHAYVPKSPIRGRVQFCSADSRAETQVAFLTHDECAQWARSGLAGVAPAGQLAFAWRPSRELPPVPEEPLAVTAPEEERLTLKQWCHRGVIELPYDTVKKRRQRDRAAGTFVDTFDGRYTEAQIVAWLAVREPPAS